MKLKVILSSVAIASLALLTGCGGPEPGPGAGPGSGPSTPSQPSGPKVAAALPDNGFKAQIEIANPPTKLRVGEKVTLNVNVKNGSDVMWYAHGGETNPNPDNKFYIAAGNRWLKADGKLVTNMDGRYGLGKDLKPGETVTIPLQITAPKDAGDYSLEIDLVQEQVAWFSDKGSSPAKLKISVVR